MTKASIEAYIKNIESGRAQSQTEKIIQALMERKFASTYQLWQDVGAKTNTIGARLNALLSIGCVHKCGQSKHNGTMYSRYMWVDDKELWPTFGELYRKELALARAKSIVNNCVDHTVGMVVRAQLEAEKLEGEIKQLMTYAPVEAI